MDKIYVCEWSREDNEIYSIKDFAILTLYDYTYHYNLEQCKILAEMKKNGYIIAKSLDPEDKVVNDIPNNIECITIWSYENCQLFAKYDFSNDFWYYSPRVDSWDYDWKDMFYLPS